MENISENTKLEIAVEIIAAKIAKHSIEGNNSENEEVKKLIKERNEMYKGNKIIIDKIIKDYGIEIKSIKRRINGGF